jgi:ribosomal protein L40E
MRPSPRSPRPPHAALLLSGVLLIGIAFAWGIQRHADGYPVWQGFVEWPWAWILGIGTFVLGLVWLFNRPVSPEVTEVVTEVLRRLQLERTVCRHCGQQLDVQSLTCRSCGRVVNWPNVAGAASRLLILIVWLAYVILRVW